VFYDTNINVFIALRRCSEMIMGSAYEYTYQDLNT